LKEYKGFITVDEWIIWSYRILLGREPENDAVVRAHAKEDFSLKGLRNTLMGSEEFQALAMPHPSILLEKSEMRRLKAEFAVSLSKGCDGFFVDFLGVRTRCSYLPISYAGFSGAVEQAEGVNAVPLHESAEIVALLTSIKEATQVLTVLELGAGWGPWLVAGAVAARQCGLEARLIGVEGDKAHVSFMRTHMEDNGLDPDDHRLIWAVVGAEDGTAHFPILPDPSADWGAKADFSGDRDRLSARASSYIEVQSRSISSLVRELDKVDIAHCDIQGAEADALESSIDAVNTKIRRLVIGTHGRAIEERLIMLLSKHSWILEHEKACTFQQTGTQMVLLNDGVQVWRNVAIP